jgi:hypothetical protein
MIFNSLDFHLNTRYGEEPTDLYRSFRGRINHIVDSFAMRIPKKIRTELFHKLNVTASYKQWQRDPFYALEGIGNVELVVPEIASIYELGAAKTIPPVKEYLRVGIRIAAEADRHFAQHLDLWDELLETTEREFDFDLRIARSHRSRQWRTRAVMRITPTAYHYDVLVEESKSGEEIQRHRIKTTECFYPFYRGIGYSQLRWENGDIVGRTNDEKEVFRFETGLPS